MKSEDRPQMKAFSRRGASLLEKPLIEYFRILPSHFGFSFMNTVSSWWVGTLQEYLREEERGRVF